MKETWKDALSAIDDKKTLIGSVADQIWEYAELSLEEKRSCALFCKVLRDEGFRVEQGICGIETAFSAAFGSSRPVIGILAEYDALSGLSQKRGTAHEEPAQRGANGHGCGHNLLGAGALAAALGVKRYLERSGRPGTVVLYGCPGEEGGAAKAFMARDGLWKGLDAALTWHPSDCNEIAVGSNNATLQVQYTFHGLAAHAAGAPEQGRSALDAVELMNIGVQFLREHMPDRARVHYALTDAGGRSANVVQAHAAVLYMTRSPHVKDALALQERVDRIASGAALMTDTSFERRFIDGTSDLVPVHAFEELGFRVFSELGVPAYTPEEHAFADALGRTCAGADDAPGIGSAADAAYAEAAQAQRKAAGHALNDFLLPLYSGDAFSPGSTDVGDVSQLTPALQFHVTAWPNGCPGHSWQNVSCGGTEIGRKAAHHAGKLIAACAIELFEDSALLAAIRAEWTAAAARHPYVCPIPPDAVPTVAD